MGGAFAVPGHFDGQIPANGEKRFTEDGVAFIFLQDRDVAGLTVGEHEERVIGAGITVYGDHVEGVRNNGAQRLLQKRLGDAAVGGDVTEHGAHVRMDHAGAFAHAAQADGHAAAAGSGQIEFHGELLVDGIRGHDRLAGGRPGLFGIGKCFLHGGDARGDLIDRDGRADDAGGAQKHGIGGDAEEPSGEVRSLRAQGHSLITGGRIGDTGVDDYCLRLTDVINDTAVPKHGSGLDPVGGEGSGHIAGNGAQNHGHVSTALILDAGGTAGRAEALRGSDAARNLTDHRFLLL